MADLKKEIPRKLFHIVSGLSFLVILELFGKEGVLITSAVGIAVGVGVFYFGVRNWLTNILWFFIDKMEREDNLKTFPGRQAVGSLIGIFISGILFNEDVLKIVIITYSVYDGFATIFGLLFGKHKIGFGKYRLKKSYEGFLGGVIVNTLALLFVLPFKEAFIFSLVGGIFELFSSSKKLYLDDNIIVPLGTGIFAQFIYPNLTL
ncbi:MAG: hypothetical protein GXO22_03120 [Aquificae bacterium]|nr:hypothetical protein [Aquificota bacterium]